MWQCTINSWWKLNKMLFLDSKCHENSNTITCSSKHVAHFLSWNTQFYALTSTWAIKKKNQPILNNHQNHTFHLYSQFYILHHTSLLLCYTLSLLYSYLNIYWSSWHHKNHRHNLKQHGWTSNIATSFRMPYFLKESPK